MPEFLLKNRSTFFTPHKLDILLSEYSKKAAHFQEKCAENVDFIRKSQLGEAENTIEYDTSWEVSI